MRFTERRVWAKSKPKKPKPQLPPPVQDTATTDVAAKKAEALRRQRGGAVSTALSDTLGG